MARAFFGILCTLTLLAPSLFSQMLFAHDSLKTAHLFYIERSTNRNIVQYDVCLTKTSDLPDSNPVTVYWILENGKYQELDSIERRYAYGVARQEKIGPNKFRLRLSGLSSLEIVVEKIDGSYRAVSTINGKRAAIKKFFIKSEENPLGFPTVLYTDLYGNALKTSKPVKERITLKRSSLPQGSLRAEEEFQPRMKEK